jgi:hypothetical protein
MPARLTVEHEKRRPRPRLGELCAPPSWADCNAGRLLGGSQSYARYRSTDSGDNAASEEKWWRGRRTSPPDTVGPQVPQPLGYTSPMPNIIGKDYEKVGGAETPIGQVCRSLCWSRDTTGGFGVMERSIDWSDELNGFPQGQMGKAEMSAPRFQRAIKKELAPALRPGIECRAPHQLTNNNPLCAPTFSASPFPPAASLDTQLSPCSAAETGGLILSASMMGSWHNDTFALIC